MSEPRVAVIVPVFNAERTLPRLINSLRRQTYPADRVHVIMVDNNSTDASAALIQRHPRIQLLSQTQYQTPGATRNAGVKAADADVLAFIDADCWAHPDWLARGVSTLTSKGLDRVAGHVEFVLSPRPNIYEVYDSQVNFRQTDFLEADWCGTGNLFARPRAFEIAGLFDPALVSAEDFEFGRRATRAGLTLGFEPSAVIYHCARRSLLSLVRKWMRTEYGAAQVFRRHGLLELHLWNRKANYRPLWGVWRKFAPAYQRSPRMRLAVDGIANILRCAGNMGSFMGYFNLDRRPS
ncbi:MAG TPA: glycosyltransferase [Candidatus Brocadiia bacterium]|nr:glycosyltransferase [Candidatus Brocadiia bacterium]